MVEPTMKTLARQVDRVERDKWRLKLSGVVALVVIAAVVLLNPVLALGADVTRWKQIDEISRKMYVAGAADAINIVGDMLEHDLKAGTHLLVKGLVDISDCLIERNMKFAQTVAIVEKYVNNNPELWHNSVGSLTWFALREACGLTEKK